MAYCEKTDLLTGDIPLAGKYGDGESFVNFAADEIDGQIGHIYITPIKFDKTDPIKAGKARPAELLLKKINVLLASGRIILDMAAGGEDDNLHSYGSSMLREGVNLLNSISSRKIELTEAPTLDQNVGDQDTGPSIVNEDESSLVAGFYARYGSAVVAPGHLRPLRPYGL